MTFASVRPVLAAAVVFLLAGPAVADAPVDTGKKRILALFQPAAAAVSPSVAWVRVNGQNVSLATVVSADGYLLTKGSDLSGDLTVVLRDGTTHEAQRIAYHRPTDLAMLKIDADKLTPVEFAADDAASEVGNWVAAPGPGSDPIAVGVVSVAARRLYHEQAEIENGNKGVLGITFNGATDGAVRVNSVADKSGAARAGIKKGDVITQIGGKPVATQKDLKELLDGYKPGDKVEVEVDRDGETLTVTVTLRPRDDRSTFQNSMGGVLSGRRTGFPKVVQHDTILKPAQCGGPLVDLDGRVLGINIARAGRVETWALPPSVVKPVLKEMLEGKHAVAATKPEKDKAGQDAVDKSK